MTHKIRNLLQVDDLDKPNNIYSFFELAEVGLTCDLKKEHRKFLHAFTILPRVAALLLLCLHALLILKLKAKKCDILHYKIYLTSNKNGFDPRSAQADEALRQQKTVKVVHCASILKYFASWDSWGSDTIYFRALLPSTFLSLFVRNWHATSNRNSPVFKAICNADITMMSFVIRCLSPKLFLMLDDPRWTALMRFSCHREKVKAMGYMHARFNEFHVGLFGKPFDEYFVWSKYFQELYTANATKQGATRFWIRGMNASKQLSDFPKIKNVLFVDDDQTPIATFLPFAEELAKIRGVNVFFKLKNDTFHTHKDLNFIKDADFPNVMTNWEIKFVVGGISTCLIEAYVYGAISISVTPDNKYGEHLMRDGLALSVNSPQALSDLIMNLSLADSRKIINNQKEIHGIDLPISLSTALDQAIREVSNNHD